MELVLFTVVLLFGLTAFAWQNLPCGLLPVVCTHGRLNGTSNWKRLLLMTIVWPCRFVGGDSPRRRAV